MIMDYIAILLGLFGAFGCGYFHRMDSMEIDRRHHVPRAASFVPPALESFDP